MDRNDVLNLKDPPNGFKDQAINAGILAGYTFFSTLAGLAIIQIKTDPFSCLVAAGIAAGFSFFGSLMTQRKLAKPTQTS